MSRPLVIYHANCLDGFGAAYATWRHFQAQGVEADYLAASHGEPPPECRGRDLYIVDFSYKREVMHGICAQAASVAVLDHHVSAEQDLVGLEAEYDNLTVVFDMERSGAVITWQHFHRAPVPQLLLHIQDQDLWRFTLKGTQDINAALFSHPFDFGFWEEATLLPERMQQLLHEGAAINRFRRQQIDYYKERAVMGNIAGCQVPVVNCPRAIASELLGELAEGQPFAAGYQDKGNKRSWSLRSSRNGGEDVAKIAERFGGGGHRNAAGFATLLPESLLSLEPE